MECLIDIEELRARVEQGENKDLKILDATLPAPGADHDHLQGFIEKRITGAQFFDIEAASDHSSDLPHMLPDAEAFAAYVSELGIGNEDMVVLYGQEGLIMGPARAWWMFRVFGHDRVCVLDGGLPAWLDQWYPLDMAAPRAQKSTPANFRAHLRQDLLVTRAQMESSIKTPGTIIMDARPHNRFAGTMPEPRPGLLCGHIPGSINIPAVSLVNADTRKMRSRDEIEEIAARHGITGQSNIIASCGSGVTACVLALAFHRIGLNSIAVYDGSWAEWGQESLALPIARVA